MANDLDDKPWTRQLFVVIGVLVAVALIIGGIVSVFALGAAKLTGVDSSTARASSKPSLYVPSGKPTVGLEPYPEPSGVPHQPKSSPTDKARSSGSQDAADKQSPQKKAISLQLFPQQVSPGKRINMTGVYANGEGATLQVQRFEGGAWTDFPATTTVSGGQFSTYITTSHVGVQRFRVTDKASHRKSNAVRVRVG